MPRTSPKQTQVSKFKDAARKLGCDEDEAAFEAKLKKIAKPSPPKPERKKGKSKS